MLNDELIEILFEMNKELFVIAVFEVKLLKMKIQLQMLLALVVLLQMR
jgi:hypothetical protein